MPQINPVNHTVLKEGTQEYELFRACRVGDYGLVNEILKQDVNLDFQNSDEDDFTALHHAVHGGYVEIVELLVQAGAKSNLKTQILQYNPLHIVASSEDIENPEAIIRALIKAKDCNIDEVERYGKTVLHHVALTGRVDLMKLFLDLGCDVNAQEKNLWSPLHWACYNDHAEAIKVLLAANAHTDIKETDSWTPLHWAAFKAFPNTVELLLQGGANCMMEDKEGHMPLYVSTLACMGLRTEECLQVFRLLLDAGADVNHAGCVGWTALHRAAEKENVEFLEMLLAEGANPDVQNIGGDTPLHIATSANIPANVKVLLDGDASMDIRDLDWKSPFQTAVNRVLPGVVKTYLGAGAAIKVKPMDVEQVVTTGTIGKQCSTDPYFSGPLDYTGRNISKSDIITVLYLLHQSGLLSSSTTKRMLALLKHYIEVPTLKCMARTCAQVYMHCHTSEAYEQLGLPTLLQKYMEYDY